MTQLSWCKIKSVIMVQNVLVVCIAFRIHGKCFIFFFTLPFRSIFVFLLWHFVLNIFLNQHTIFKLFIWYARHHNPLLITNRSWILTIHKGRIFWKNLLEKTFLTFKKWVKIYKPWVIMARVHFKKLKRDSMTDRTKNVSL